MPLDSLATRLDFLLSPWKIKSTIVHPSESVTRRLIRLDSQGCSVESMSVQRCSIPSLATKWIGSQQEELLGLLILACLYTPPEYGEGVVFVPKGSLVVLG